MQQYNVEGVPDQPQAAPVPTRGWGVQIDRMSQDPWAPRILHKVERNGCCLPAVWQDMCCGCIPLCATPKKRSYLWIMEGGVEENLACCLVFDPFTCTCCTAADHVSKDYFDNSNYKPCCQSFCGDNFKKGIATENDMNYCCFCINCVCCYDICCKPCYGACSKPLRPLDTTLDKNVVPAHRRPGVNCPLSQRIRLPLQHRDTLLPALLYEAQAPLC